MSLPPINLVADEPAVDRIVEKRVREYAADKSKLEILEAGCGRRWPYDFSGIRYVLTGVDVDQDALRVRQETKGDLDHVVHGDLRTVALPQHRFDIIYSAFVLEHIREAERALANFTIWLKPGGLMVLKFPDRDSVYGFVTRVTPHSAHIAYKRYLMNKPDAGKPGFGPYPTVHEKIIARQHFRDYAARHGLVIRDEYGFGTLPRFQRMGTRAISWLTFGQLTADYVNLLYIIETAPDPTIEYTERSDAVAEGTPVTV